MNRSCAEIPPHPALSLREREDRSKQWPLVPMHLQSERWLRMNRRAPKFPLTLPSPSGRGRIAASSGSWSQCICERWLRMNGSCAEIPPHPTLSLRERECSNQRFMVPMHS